jgi:hypothetical protein
MKCSLLCIFHCLLLSNSLYLVATDFDNLLYLLSRYHHNNRQCACASASTKHHKQSDYPPMNRQYLECRCAMYPDGHMVAKTEKLKHALELKNATIQVSLFDMILILSFNSKLFNLNHPGRCYEKCTTIRDAHYNATYYGSG